MTALKTEGVSIWTTAKCLILLIGSSKHEVHRLLRTRYQRTQENRSFPFTDILTLMSNLQDTVKNVNVASPLKIQRLKSFQLQGQGPGPCWGSAPGSFDECRLSAANPQTKPTDLLLITDCLSLQSTLNKQIYMQEIHIQYFYCQLYRKLSVANEMVVECNERLSTHSQPR